MQAIATRRAAGGHSHRSVVDIFKPALPGGGREVLCVCLDCGVTWPEGGLCGECVPSAPPARRT